MRAELTRRLAALEVAAARRRLAAPPADDMPHFSAMSDEALDAWLRDPPPPPDDVAAELADLAERIEVMTDQELDAYLAEEFGLASGDATR